MLSGEGVGDYIKRLYTKQLKNFIIKNFFINVIISTFVLYNLNNMYNKLTKDDIIEVMKLLNKPSEPRREFVFMTGIEGMFLFDLAMRGIGLPNNVKYTKTTFKHKKGFLYLNIGRKEGNTKMLIDMNNKTYTAYYSTIKLGTTNSAESCVRLYLNKYLVDKK